MLEKIKNKLFKPKQDTSGNGLYASLEAYGNEKALKASKIW